MLFHGREARPASVGWNLFKTCAGMVVLWALCFAAIPYLCYRAESALGLADYRFHGPVWQATGVVLLALGSILHLVANLALALYGEGTPLYLDAPRRLVIAGPYRFVRNPITVAILAQGIGVAFLLGSPLTLVVVLTAVLLEHLVVRPREEANLERRFGEAYRVYHRRVRCWRPRLHGYDLAREAEEPPLAAERTTPPGRYAVLYDGSCKFCTLGVEKLLRLARGGAIEKLSFQEPGVLDQFPGVSPAACMRQMYLITPDGHVYGGFEAAVQAVATRRPLGWIAFAYYLPGVRLLLDCVYALIATNRYRLMGKMLAAGECEGGTCALHGPRTTAHQG
jgi:protein-S-isoprenylcysteine O-methyltransferase Ste14/predicted DCC family thiol-disulfide oxidoreductase YuxK